MRTLHEEVKYPGHSGKQLTILGWSRTVRAHADVG